LAEGLLGLVLRRAVAGREPAVLALRTFLVEMKAPDHANPDLFMLTVTVKWDSRALKRERAVRYSRYCYAP
jgi:hypothetical protein